MPKVSIPNICYLDTNYILRLLAFSNSPGDPKAIKCKSFYDKCVRQRCILVTSILTYEECIYILFYKRKLLKECNKLFVRGGGTGQFNLKQFIKDSYSDFTNVYSRHLTVPISFHKNLKSLGIKFKLPKYMNPTLDASARIISYALAIIRNHNTIEPTDAFHIALARCMGVKTIITSDRAFNNVHTIDVIDPIVDTF